MFSYRTIQMLMGSDFYALDDLCNVGSHLQLEVQHNHDEENGLGKVNGNVVVSSSLGLDFDHSSHSLGFDDIVDYGF